MVVVAAVLVINIRLVLTRDDGPLLARAHPVVAAVAAICSSIIVCGRLDGYRAGRGQAHAFYLGGAVLLWVSWLAAIGAGAAAGARLRHWLHLEFVTPLFLVGGGPQACQSSAAPSDLRRHRGAASLSARCARHGAGNRGGHHRRSHHDEMAGPPRTRFSQPRRYGDECLMVIPAAGLGGYLFRLSMIVLARITMPDIWNEPQFCRPAAFAAWLPPVSQQPGPGGHPGRSAAGRGRRSRHRRLAHRLAHATNLAGMPTCGSRPPAGLKYLRPI